MQYKTSRFWNHVNQGAAPGMQMPHPREREGKQMPRGSRGVGADGINWRISFYYAILNFFLICEMGLRFVVYLSTKRQPLQKCLETNLCEKWRL